MSQDSTNVLSIVPFFSGPIKEKTPQEMRESIMKLEEVMLKMPQVEMKVEHHFAPGIYMRQLSIPKGTALTGKIHKTEHLSILSQGKMLNITEEGKRITLTASTVVKSMPGMKRAGIALEDSVWITVHANVENETDVLKLEDMLTANSFEDLLAFTEQKKIEGDK